MSSLPLYSQLGASLKTILVVDDDIPLATTLCLLLEASGYRALSASDAVTGLKMAHVHLPDLILSDIDMPGKDGRCLLQEMRAAPAIAHCQFVLMTGKPAFGNQRTAMDLGADDFLLKPFPLPILLACIAARLRRAELSRRVDDHAVEQLRQSLGEDLPQKFFTPLASILGLAQLLRAELKIQRPAETQQDLREIEAAARRLHRTLRNHLLLLEGEAQDGAALLAPIGAEETRTALGSGINAAATRHERTADLDLDLTGCRLRVTPAALAVVVEEIVDNALSFSRKGTPVRVRAWSDGTSFHCTVADRGRGLTAPQLDLVRTSNWHDPARREQPGSGVGLTLVRRLVTRCGGEFDLESEAGEGTTCRFSLPVDCGRGGGGA